MSRVWFGPHSGVREKWGFPNTKTADFSVSERETGVVWPEVWVSMRLDALNARNVDFKVRERV